jgi:hypothetical protein
LVTAADDPLIQQQYRSTANRVVRIEDVQCANT